MKLAVLLLALSVGGDGCSAHRAGNGAPTAAGRPPAIVLQSAAGHQRAVQGSSCVQVEGGSGASSGTCADTGFPAPTLLSVVRPGERVRLAVAGARAVDLDVHRLGCHRASLRRVRLGAGGRWRVRLRPGLYELMAFVPHFKRGSASGDTSGGVGLWVSREHRLELVAARSVSAPGC